MTIEQRAARIASAIAGIPDDAPDSEILGLFGPDDHDVYLFLYTTALRGGDEQMKIASQRLSVTPGEGVYGLMDNDEDPFAAAIRRGRLRPPSEYGAERIDAAIDSYAERAGSGSGAPPYDSGSLAEIYAPRVQELFDLQAQGFTYAKWGWDETLKTNRWHGVADSEGRPN